MAAATPVLRQSESSNAGLFIFGVLALAALGGVGGVMLAVGELDAFWICIGVLASLAVLPAGPVPPNPLELLSRGTFGALLGKAAAEYDVILIDTPPASDYADAQCVSFRAGDALLVSRKDHTRIGDTERTVRELSDASARIVGTLMNAF